MQINESYLWSNQPWSVSATEFRFDLWRFRNESERLKELRFAFMDIQNFADVYVLKFYSLIHGTCDPFLFSSNKASVEDQINSTFWLKNKKING